MTDLIAVLIQMRDGEVACDVNRKFNDMLQSVYATGGEGKIDLSIKVKPSKMAMGGAVLEVETSHECKIKKPELSLGRSLFFVGDEGLTRDNPAQDRMFEETKEVRNVRPE